MYIATFIFFFFFAYSTTGPFFLPPGIKAPSRGYEVYKLHFRAQGDVGRRELHNILRKKGP